MKNKPVFRQQYITILSVQLRYLGMSILPALVVGIFSLFLLLSGGQFLIFKAKGEASTQLSSLDNQIQLLAGRHMAEKTVSVDKLNELRKDILGSRLIINKTHQEIISEWQNMTLLMLAGMLAILLCVTVLSVLYSHRITGPLVRIRRIIEMMADKQPVPVVKLRKYDEFQDLAAALNRLSSTLKP